MFYLTTLSKHFNLTTQLIKNFRLAARVLLYAPVMENWLERELFFFLEVISLLLVVLLEEKLMGHQ